LRSELPSESEIFEFYNAIRHQNDLPLAHHESHQPAPKDSHKSNNHEQVHQSQPEFHQATNVQSHVAGNTQQYPNYDSHSYNPLNSAPIRQEYVERPVQTQKQDGHMYSFGPVGTNSQVNSHHQSYNTSQGAQGHYQGTGSNVVYETRPSRVISQVQQPQVIHNNTASYSRSNAPAYSKSTVNTTNYNTPNTVNTTGNYRPAQSYTQGTSYGGQGTRVVQSTLPQNYGQSTSNVVVRSNNNPVNTGVKYSSQNVQYNPQYSQPGGSHNVIRR